MKTPEPLSEFTIENYYARTVEDLKRDTASIIEKHPEIKSNYYPPELKNLFMQYIEVHGHAYCMDEESEREKIAELLYNLLNTLKK
ncbi:hypothetical protein ACFL55_02550 [Candidatus Latescibacterota bacterium]